MPIITFISNLIAINASFQLTKEFLTLDNTFLDSLVDTTANFDFVAVIASTIDQSVKANGRSVYGKGKGE